MRDSKSSEQIARRYFIRGRVQGVGFRFFVERIAHELGIRGYTRNLADGGVEVYAVGTREQLAELSGYLRQGPRLADVRGVDVEEAPLEKVTGFRITW